MKHIFRVVLVLVMIASAASVTVAFSNQPNKGDLPENKTDYPVTANETDNIKAAKRALADLVYNFEQENFFDFFNLISDRMDRAYLDFKGMVENDFRSFDATRIQYFIDDIEAEGNVVAINFHWDRTWQATGMLSPAPTLMQGVTQFIFEIEDGEAKLGDQTGGVLFGVTP